MIDQLVEARAIFSGNGRRVIGSTDVRGNGTEFAVPELDPFVLVDDARGIDGPDMPPFGRHPHAGLVAVSYIIDGGPWRSWCNLPGAEHHAFGAGDVLITNAGGGAVHDERTVGDGAHAMLQVILRLPESHREIEASVSPLLAEEGAENVRRIVGAEHLRPMGIDASVHYCTPPAGHSVEVAVPATQTAGFVFTRAGSVTLAEEHIPEDHVALLDEPPHALRITAAGGGPAQVIIGLGAPHDEPWAKLLGHNGFVVAGDEAAAAAKLDAYAREGEQFGLPR